MEKIDEEMSPPYQHNEQSLWTSRTQVLGDALDFLSLAEPTLNF